MGMKDTGGDAEQERGRSLADGGFLRVEAFHLCVKMRTEPRHLKSGLDQIRSRSVRLKGRRTQGHQVPGVY